MRGFLGIRRRGDVIIQTPQGFPAVALGGPLSDDLAPQGVSVPAPAIERTVGSIRVLADASTPGGFREHFEPFAGSDAHVER